MNSKKSVEKRVVLGILLIGIVIVSIGFVSAKWWIFGDDNGGEGELPSQSATAKVDVQAPATPPTVWWVSKLNTTSQAADPIPVAGSSYFSFNFYACSVGGLSQLPDAGALGKVSGTRNAGTAITIDAASCAYVNTVNLVPPSGCGTSTQSKNYSCTAQMYYFYDRYDPATGANINWIINASLVDPQNRVVSNLSQTFLMGIVRGWAMTPNFINWSSLQSGAAPTEADNEIKIVNQGNVDIDATPAAANVAAPLNISATNLMRGGGVENISTGNFSAAVYTSTPCIIPPGDKFIDQQFVNINPFEVLHTTSTPTTPQANNLSFCIQTITVSTGIYETGPLASQKWTIRALEP